MTSCRFDQEVLSADIELLSREGGGREEGREGGRERVGGLEDGSEGRGVRRGAQQRAG